jgi:hypothetical protein
VGIPGSGLSFSSFTPKDRPDGGSETHSKGSDTATGCGCLLLLLVAVFALGRCGGGGDELEAEQVAIEQPAALYSDQQQSGVRDQAEALPPSGASLQFDDGDTIYVTASTLNGRSTPSADGQVVTKLSHGQSAQIVERSGEWLKVVTNVGAVWIASSYASSSRPRPRAASPRPHSNSRRYGGACPCSGNNVCIGPRGGRYCITSGGNKRYGV